MHNAFENSYHASAYYYPKKTKLIANKFVHTYNFFFVEFGKISVFCCGKTFSVNKNELIYIPIEHYTDIYIEMPDTIATVVMLRYFPGVDELDYAPQVITLDSQLQMLVKEIPCTKTDKINSLFIWKTYKFLDLVQQKMVKNNDPRIANLEKALLFMRENNTYTIPELATYCGMSERRFYAAFKEIIGITPIQMKQKIQATKAELLLKNTDLSVEEIAKQVGYSSDTHFRNVFKKRYYHNPKEIRRLNV